MSAFPADKLPLPPPVDGALGQEILNANPWIKTGDEAETVRNITAYMQATLSYRLDPGARNYWVQPRDVLVQGSGNCEDSSVVLLSIATAAGIPSGLAFYFDPKKNLGHTVAYVPIKKCCAELSFFYIVDNSEPAGVRLWEAKSLKEAAPLFNYQEVEEVTEARLWPGLGPGYTAGNVDIREDET